MHHAPKTAPSLLKFKRDFENANVEEGKDPDDWTSDLEWIQMETENIDSACVV